MAIFLVVKGDRFVAAREASARRIPFVFSCERPGETHGATSDAFACAVVNWYRDGASEAPFEPGTLLFYRLDSTHVPQDAAQR